MQVDDEDFEELARAAFRSVTIGAGTCDRAKFLILLGNAHEQNILAKRRVAPPSVGRPSKGSYGGKDCFRAFTIWRFARILVFAKPLSNRELIDVMVQLAELGIVERHVFPAHSGNTAQRMMSRGKR